MNKLNLHTIEQNIKTSSNELIIDSIRDIRLFNKTRKGPRNNILNKVFDLLWSELQKRGIEIQPCDPRIN